MIDNDKSAVEALLRVKYGYECSETDDHRTDLAIVNQDVAGSSREAAARAILAAIRTGKVPGVYCGALYGAQLQANAELRAEVERLRASLGDGPDAQAKDITRMRAERDAEKARADKAEDRAEAGDEAMATIRRQLDLEQDDDVNTALMRVMENLREGWSHADKMKAYGERAVLEERNRTAQAERERDEARERLEQAVALLREARKHVSTHVSIGIRTFNINYENSTITEVIEVPLAERIDAFLAGQPAHSQTKE